MSEDNETPERVQRALATYMKAMNDMPDGVLPEHLQDLFHGGAMLILNQVRLLPGVEFNNYESFQKMYRALLMCQGIAYRQAFVKDSNVSHH